MGTASIARITAFSAWNLLSSHAFRNSWPRSSSSSAMTPSRVPETWQVLKCTSRSSRRHSRASSSTFRVPSTLARQATSRETVSWFRAARWKMRVTLPATRSTSSPERPR
jgi:hypothetical protein